MNTLQQAIDTVLSGRDLPQGMMKTVMDTIMDGQATDAQIGALLAGLRMKGESPGEIAEAASAMREKATAIRPKIPGSEHLVDTCGTGGDKADTFNISTTAAIVAAGAGVRVAKHGNRSVSSRSGSADLLEALGVNIGLSPEKVAMSIDTIGIGFLFAQSLHPAMKNVAGPRRELGVRTMFNLLGPLTNPAGADVQVMGVFDPEFTETLAQVLAILGSHRAWVVHGEGGLDEISLLGKTRVSQWNGQEVTTFELDPERYGFSLCAPEEIKGGTPSENAEITMEILEGADGPCRDIVLLNAAAAVFLSGVAEDYGQALELCARSIDSGAALEKLKALSRI